MAKINAPGLRQAIKQQFQASRKRWLSAMDAAWYDIAKGIIKHFTSTNDPTVFLSGTGEFLVPTATGGGVTPTRAINTTSPLAGGGDLSADRTLTISVGTGAGDVAAGNHDHTGVYAPVSHAHAQSDVSGLAAALAAKQDVDSDLTALSAVTTNGALVRSAGPAYTTRAIGISAGTDIPDRDAADARYALLSAVLAPTDADPQLMLPPWWHPRDAFTQVVLGSTQCHAYYFGRAMKAYTSFDILYRLTQSGSVFSWGEMAIGKSTKPTPAGARNITVVGTTDATATWSAATGNKTTTVTVAGGQSIAVGDHLWLVVAKLSTGTPNFRACPTADEFDLGIILEGGNVRPSTIQGTPTSFAAGQTTRTPMNFAVYPT